MARSILYLLAFHLQKAYIILNTNSDQHMDLVYLAAFSLLYRFLRIIFSSPSRPWRDGHHQ